MTCKLHLNRHNKANQPGTPRRSDRLDSGQDLRTVALLSSGNHTILQCSLKFQNKFTIVTKNKEISTQSSNDDFDQCQPESDPTTTTCGASQPVRPVWRPRGMGDQGGARRSRQQRATTGWVPAGALGAAPPPWL